MNDQDIRKQVDQILGRPTKEQQLQLLAEIEDVLRTVPPSQSLWNEEPANYAWLGRASAVIEAWSPHNVSLTIAMSEFHAPGAIAQDKGLAKLLILLHQAQNDLRMKTLGPVNSAIGQGRAFEYFDELRKLIESASSDVFFIDPYLNADFVARFLPFVAKGVTIRLLGRDYMSTLLPAVAMYTQQSGAAIEVRSPNSSMHDRYLIVDRSACYQSGASFKDGGQKAFTTITQITDVLPAVLDAYEKLWAAATIRK
jgi:hypothetical protein